MGQEILAARRKAVETTEADDSSVTIEAISALNRKGREVAISYTTSLEVARRRIAPGGTTPENSLTTAIWVTSSAIARV